MPDPAVPSGPGTSGWPELLDRLHVGRFQTTLEGELLDANEAFLRLLGFSSLDDASGCRTADIYARPEDRAAAIRRTLDEGTVNDQVLQLRRRDGSLLWVSVVEVASRLPDGRVVFTGILHETGERVVAAQELRASADRYERLVEQANVAIFLGDAATGRLLHANLRAQELIGRSLDEVQQMFQWELHPEPERTRYEAIFREHAGAMKATQAEAEVVDREGTRIPVQISASLVELAGRPVVQGVFHDLRGLHQARQALEESAFRYRQLVELSPDAIAVHCEGRLVFVNATAARMLGADSPDELVGRPVIDFVHPDSRQVVRERVQRMLASGQAEPLLEERFQRLDGTPVEVEVAAGPFTYLGQPAIQVVFRDITERKHMREELERSQAQQAAILAALPVAVYSAEVPGDLDATWMSSSIERFTGFPAERFMTEPDFWSSRLHPEDRQKTIASYRTAIETGEAQVEYRWQVRDGSFRWLSDHAVCVARRESTMHVIGVIADISDRRLAEQALRDSEETYRDLVEKIGEAIFTVDADGILTFISAAAHRIIGFEPVELVGRHFSSFIHPEDLPALVDELRADLPGRPAPQRVPRGSQGRRPSLGALELPADPATGSVRSGCAACWWTSPSGGSRSWPCSTTPGGSSRCTTSTSRSWRRAPRRRSPPRLSSACASSSRPSAPPSSRSTRPPATGSTWPWTACRVSGMPTAIGPRSATSCRVSWSATARSIFPTLRCPRCARRPSTVCSATACERC